MKTTNKIIAVSILAMLAVPAAHAKIVAETMLSEESGHYSSTHTVQSEINAKQDTANMETNTSSFNVDSTTKYPSMAVAQKMIEDSADTLSDEITDLQQGKVDVAQGSGAASKAVITDASGNVTTGTIASGMIASKAVTAAKIADSTITSTQLANNAVTTAKITDANVTKAKLASDVQTSLGKADTALQAADITGKVDVAQGSSAASKAVITDASGNVTTGTITSGMITDGTITTSDISSTAGITKSQLASDVQTSLGKADTALQEHQDISGKVNVAQGSSAASKAVVTDSSGNVTTGTIATGMIANKAVTAAKIADSTITSTQLANNAVTTAKITDANVTKAKLASDVQTSLGKADTALQAADITGKQDIQIGAAKSGTTASTDSGKAVVVDDDGKIAMSTNKLGTLAYKSTVVSADITDGTITTSDISNSAGITKTQLASAVQTSLGKADTALQASNVTSTYSATGTAPVNGTAVASAISNLNSGGTYEVTANKVTSVTSSSTDTQYPSAKAVNAEFVERNLPDGASVVALTPSTAGKYVLTAEVITSGSNAGTHYYWEDIGR